MWGKAIEQAHKAIEQFAAPTAASEQAHEAIDRFEDLWKEVPSPTGIGALDDDKFEDWREASRKGLLPSQARRASQGSSSRNHTNKKRKARDKGGAKVIDESQGDNEGYDGGNASPEGGGTTGAYNEGEDNEGGDLETIL
jgi:hypothetical protein